MPIKHVLADTSEHGPQECYMCNDTPVQRYCLACGVPLCGSCGIRSYRTGVVVCSRTCERDL